MDQPTQPWQPRDLLAERDPELDSVLTAWDPASVAADNAERGPASALLNDMRAKASSLGLEALLRDLSAGTGVADGGSSYGLIAIAEQLVSSRITFEDATAVFQASEITDKHRIVAVLYASALPRLRQNAIDLVVLRLAADTASSDELAARCYINVGDRTVNDNAEYALQAYSRGIEKVGHAKLKELRAPSLLGLARCWIQLKRFDDAAKAARESKGLYEQSGDTSGAELAEASEAVAHISNEDFSAAAMAILPVVVRQQQHGIASGSVDGAAILTACIKAAARQAFRLAQTRNVAAVEAYDAAIGLAGETAYQYQDEATDRCLIGQALVLGDSPAVGQRQLELAVEVARAQGQLQVLLTTLSALGDWLRHVQDPRAMTVAEEGLAIAEKLNDPEQIVNMEVLVGSALNQAGQLDTAIEHLGRANSLSSRPAFRALWILALFRAHREREALEATATLDAELAALPPAEVTADAEHLSTFILDLVKRGHTGLAQRLSARLEAAGGTGGVAGAVRNEEHASDGQETLGRGGLREFQSHALRILAFAGTQLMSGNLAAVVAAGEPLLKEARRLGALNIELATAYMLGETAMNGRRYSDSLRLLESVAAKAKDVQPRLYASALNKIGTVFTQMGRPEMGLPYQERAIEAHRAQGDWSPLVVDLVQAAQSCVILQRLEQAQIYADELENLGPKYPPADAEWVTSVPALVAARRGNWEKAKRGFRDTIAELERKRQQFTTADQQRVWGQQKADLYGQAIEAAIMSNDGEEAITYFELARNRYLNAIAREKATLSPTNLRSPNAELSARGSGTSGSLADLLPQNCAFVWCAAFVRGTGIVAAAWHQGKLVLACRFYPELTHETIEKLRRGEIGKGPEDLLDPIELMKQPEASDDQSQRAAFWQSGGGEHWNRTIQRVVESVRATVWTRIIETVGEPKPLVVLLPSVGCTELPLAAAAPDRWPDNVPLSVCFAPSLASLTPLAALDSTLPRTLIQVENPTEDASLACSSLECQSVGRLFPTKPHVLRGRRAHRGHVEEVMAGADVFHFMGHAWCDWHEPLDSGLLCAGRSNEPQGLTVRELFSAGHIKSRLIVLSACEISNVQPGDKQNDFINLPAALVALGAHCVVAPRWRVDDVAASMFTANLFERWLTGASISEALAAARRWLRDEVTRLVVESWLDNRDADTPGAGRMEDIKRSFREKYQPDDRPFSHVAHWGAFELTGDPYPFGVPHD